MMNNNDLWIADFSQIVDIDNTVPVTPWYPYMGNLRVNIICKNISSATHLDKLLQASRTIRVGSEAHYPQIIIWMDRQIAFNTTFKAIAKIDKYVPRIRVIIVDVLENDLSNIPGILSQASQCFVDSKFLLVSYGQQQYDFQLDNNLIEKIYFEWFLGDSCNDNWNKCYGVIAHLNKLGYNFNKHPLALCGGIALLQRSLMLSHFGISPVVCPTDNDMSTNNFHLNKGSFTFLKRPCSLGAIKNILGSKINSSKLNCTCTVKPISVDIAKYKEFANLIDSKYGDYILYEDWQYIYDGFDLI